MSLGLSGCFATTKIKTEYIKFPARLLECENLPEKTPTTSQEGWERLKQNDYSILAQEVLNVSKKAYKNHNNGNSKQLIIELLNISSDAYDQALEGDHRLMFLETTDNIIKERQSEANKIHKKCVNNAADAREHQESLNEEI